MDTKRKIKKVTLKKNRSPGAIPNYDWLKMHMSSCQCTPELEALNKNGYPDYIKENLDRSIKLVRDAYKSRDEWLTNTSVQDLLKTIYICTFYFCDRITNKFGQRFYIKTPHVLIDGTEMVITLKGTDGRYYGRLPGSNFSMRLKVQISKYTERDTDVSREIVIYHSVDVYSGGSSWSCF